MRTSLPRPGYELSRLLRQADQALTRRLGELLAFQDTSVHEWRVLGVLADGEGHPMSEIAEAVVVPAPTLTRIIDRMVENNLVYRRIDPIDRRRVLVFCSARGRSLYGRLQRQLALHEAQFEGDPNLAELVRLLEWLVNVLEGRPSEQTAPR
ncbi:hypothetical protein TH66_02345 [Carbonactinospora thermoautotrophica]|uniref:HTH marR-type domain-containing protein n=1 Tax=Carbonactinospora thermoautotrophica TaxID=1469144 RepID=A0A132N5T6_9ACTN|nr:hypothetical protein TR74_23805 [Carbonactinospora thermoautotrophica]KWX05531.1 hypothetical protein TH66_02345 [Carbonactinospora thermoautotrophica]